MIKTIWLISSCHPNEICFESSPPLRPRPMDFLILFCVCVCVFPPPFSSHLAKTSAEFLQISPVFWPGAAVGKDLIQVQKHHGNEDHTVSQSVSRSVGQSVSQSVSHTETCFSKRAHTLNTPTHHTNTPHTRNYYRKQINKKYLKIDSRSPLACSACSHPLPLPCQTPMKSCLDCPGKDGQKKKFQTSKM